MGLGGWGVLRDWVGAQGWREEGRDQGPGALDSQSWFSVLAQRAEWGPSREWVLASCASVYHPVGIGCKNLPSPPACGRWARLGFLGKGWSGLQHEG